MEKITPWLLKWGFEVETKSTGTDALNALQDPEENILVAILDLDVPGMDIEDVIRKSRNRSAVNYQYILAFGADYSKEDELILLNAGADIVLYTSISEIELQLQLHVVRRIMKHQMRQQIVQDDLWTQANQDVLTSIPNRRAIIRALEKQAIICQGKSEALGVLMIDLDHFKQINDNFGHDGGDIVLKEIAQRMKNSLRSMDMIGRFGGEEFLAVIPNCSGEQLMRLSERLRVSVNSPVQMNDRLIPVSCSIGVAVFEPNLGDEDPQLTIQQADKSLYVAKEMGRNRVVCSWTLNERNKKLG